MKTHYYEEEMKKAGDVRKMMEHRGLRGQDSAELQDTRRNKEKKREIDRYNDKRAACIIYVICWCLYARCCVET
jgi:hypothetical protein